MHKPVNNPTVLIEPMDTSQIIIYETQKRDEIEGHKKYSEVEVYGYMTLNELSTKYNISINNLATAINVPESEGSQKLGRLRNKYHFELRDLRNYIEQSVKSTK